MDRNSANALPITSPTVALRKESVDRNKYVVQCRKTLGVSLSARRAWIEIDGFCWWVEGDRVALRKESVDRNVNLRVLDGSKSSVALRKESVDRNISCMILMQKCFVVALRKESVDRNKL